MIFHPHIYETGLLWVSSRPSIGIIFINMPFTILWLQFPSPTFFFFYFDSCPNCGWLTLLLLGGWVDGQKQLYKQRTAAADDAGDASTDMALSAI